MKNGPLILTLGEPAGIGIEISFKAAEALNGEIPFFAIGDFQKLKKISRNYNIDIKKISCPSEVYKNKNYLCIFDHKLEKPIQSGVIDLKNAAQVISSIKIAVKFIKDKKASGLVTCPINKWALKVGANFKFSGHTEYLSELDGSKKKPVMMLASPSGFRVVPVTTHIPIKIVPKLLTKKLLFNTILTVSDSLKQDFGIQQPRLLITGLNPHSGENSTIGMEEKEIIEPTIKEVGLTGIKLDGPVSADTAFSETNRAKFDAFICMYHDQALIPIKTIAFSQATNITLGLSFVRTSPDHGTALDIAHKNRADPRSLIEAIITAQKITTLRLMS